MVRFGSVAIVLLFLGVQSGPCLAQEDDENTPTQQAPGEAVPGAGDQFAHRHAGGGEEDRPAASLRHDSASGDDTGLDAGGEGTGLAMDHTLLPGEIGGAPETGRALFEKPSTSLALRPDPWVFQPK
jgi:hypothetical protein